MPINRILASLAATLTLAACSQRQPCTPAEPLRIELGGRNYVITGMHDVQVIGVEFIQPSRRMIETIGDSKDKPKWCIRTPPPAAARVIAFNDPKTAALDARFAPLARYSKVALRQRGGNEQRPSREGQPASPGPVEGMTMYGPGPANAPGFVDFDADAIPGWPQRVWGHCSSPDSPAPKRYCYIRTNLRDGASLSLDLHAEDLEADSWGADLALAAELFVSLEQKPTPS